MRDVEQLHLVPHERTGQGLRIIEVRMDQGRGPQRAEDALAVRQVLDPRAAAAPGVRGSVGFSASAAMNWAAHRMNWWRESRGSGVAR